jgi:hypothetical protein
MTAILEMLTAIGVFAAGLVARLGIVFAIMVALMVPVLMVVGAGKAFAAARMWFQGYRSAGNLRFRSGLQYAPGHTWVKEEGKSLKVGLDDLAQRILPWTVAVALPSPGQFVKEGEPVATLSCGGRERELRQRLAVRHRARGAGLEEASVRRAGPQLAARRGRAARDLLRDAAGHGGGRRRRAHRFPRHASR